MKYAITGSLGHISKPVSEKLIANGHDVTIITSNANNETAIKEMGAKAAVGSVEDVQFLTFAFKDADAVYTMVPPNWNPVNWKAWIAGIGSNYAKAIRDTAVKYVVNLSSIGAHMPEGCGPVSGLYRVEAALNELEDVNVKHLRPAYFYHNLLAQADMIKHAGIMGANFGESAFPIVHPADIAEAAAEELLNLGFTGHSIRYIVGTEATGTELAGTVGEAINKPGLQWVVFTDEQYLEGAVGAGLNEEVARNYTEMGRAIRTGEMNVEYNKNKPAFSKIKPADFAREFASVFNA
jgi:uncharacterized protein YbjT (DUF2867 family)